MSWHLDTTHARVACDFPDCDACVHVPAPHADVHCAAHVDASERATAEGWQASTTGHGPDLCARHNAVLEALVNVLVAEAEALGGTPDRAKVRTLMEKSLSALARAA
jgi:hypothetical protein